MTARRSGVLCMTFCTLLLLMGRSATAAPVLDFDFTGGQMRNWGVFTIGWSFRVTSPIVVAGLGLFDAAGDGLADSHQIGLWNSTGSMLLTSTTITNANSSPVASTSGVGDWRFTPITPLLLLIGDYVVGATYGTIDLAMQRTTASTVPGVTFDTARLRDGSGLIFPSSPVPLANAGFFGPNLDVVATPEPITMVLGASGLLSLAYAGRRRLFGR